MVDEEAASERLEVRFSIPLTPSLFERVKAAARLTRRPPSNLARMLIEDGLAAIEREGR